MLKKSRFIRLNFSTLRMANFGRRTWDREEYAQLAQEEPLSHEETLKSSLSDAKLQQLKDKYTDHNRLIRQSLQNLNKKVLMLVQRQAFKFLTISMIIE